MMGAAAALRAAAPAGMGAQQGRTASVVLCTEAQVSMLAATLAGVEYTRCRQLVPAVMYLTVQYRTWSCDWPPTIHSIVSQFTLRRSHLYRSCVRPFHEPCCREQQTPEPPQTSSAEHPLSLVRIYQMMNRSSRVACWLCW